MSSKDSPIIRLDYIDGLRGVAALLVLLTHCWAFGGAPALSFGSPLGTITLAHLAAVGHIGVNLFLVLSGFCLTWPFVMNPSHRSRITLTGFLTARYRRIAPAYYVSMALFAACLFIVGGKRQAGSWPIAANSLGLSPGLGDLLTHLSFTHNLWPETVSTINGSYWSLALEFQLYLAFPLMFEFARRYGVWTLICVVLVVHVAYRSWVEFLLPGHTIDAYAFVLPANLIGRTYDFSVGMLVAHGIASVGTPSSRASSIAAVGGWACLATGFCFSVHHTVNDGIIDLLWASGFGLLVYRAGTSRSLWYRAISWRPLVAMGWISYSTYLIHQPVLQLLGGYFATVVRPGTAFFAMLATWPLIIGAATLFYLAFERPFIKRFSRDRREALAISSGVAPSGRPVVIA